MKSKIKLLSVFVLIMSLLMSVVLLSACGGENGGETTPSEPNLRTLLVTQYDVAYAESEEWTFAQFIAHADSEMPYTLVELPTSVLSVDMPYVYIRTLNMDANEVSHERVPREVLQRVENPNSVVSMNSRGTVGRASSVTTINELLVLYHRWYPNHGTITFRIIHNLPN
ncbi:MAG: hypothetical protein FWC80_05640 [Firmicutes bacterium]|nr:hypothetical protein [Bacillota bacterium]